MNHTTHLALGVMALLTSSALVSAADVSDFNVFNPTGVTATQATVNASSTYSTGSFPYSNADDGTSGQFVFGDFNRGNGDANTNVDVQLLSFSNFVNLTGIDSLRFYDANQYEPGRVAHQVTIYTSNTVQNSLAASDYSTNLGTFSLPTTDNVYNSNGGYESGGTYSEGAGTNGANFDTLTGLNIGSGVESILLDFGPETLSGYNIPNDYHVGAGFQEIQAFGAIPEPSTYAMMLAGLAALGFVVRRKSVGFQA